MKTIIILVSIICSGILVDQITKILVDNLMALYSTVPIIPDFLHLTYIQNKGAAFGMLSNHRWVFMVISTIAIIAMGIYLFRFCKERMLFKVGLALIISGGIGNMIDRVIYGYVIDMIDFRVINFAVFNVADSFVCIGAGIVFLCLVIDLIKTTKKEKEENGK